jgi:hypothetical protein
MIDDMQNNTSYGNQGKAFTYLHVERSIGIADAGIPGYTPTRVRFNNNDHARNSKVVDEINGIVFGLSSREAAKIVLSTMR